MITAADVGRAMERLRGDRTQREVARRAGIHRTTWSSYESGSRLPSRRSQEKIANGLGRTLDDLDRAILQECERRLAPDAPEPERPPPSEDLHRLYYLLDQLRDVVGRLLLRASDTGR
ncbi:MAG TPA: helix-turn-helix transcriptional regulator [Thermoanaerobaculia bacterium]|nr:helix-turn-helix transcriptional regulator [Thermoanaerobaculia bacterium]